MRTILTIAALLIITGCASGPDYRADFDRSADFGAYETYAFMDELGTDKAGYRSLITQHFKDAIRREMDALGYTYSESDPDLLVNFAATAREKTEVRSRPSSSMTMGVGYGGYYGYRAGMYGTYPMYRNEVETVNYKVGTANIDVIDADRMQLVWEGLAEGRLRDEALENPKPAIDNLVTELFKRYPTATQ